MSDPQTFEEWFTPYEQQDLIDDTHYQVASDAWDYQQVEIDALRARLTHYIKEVSRLEKIINRQAEEKMQLRDEVSSLRKVAEDTLSIRGILKYASLSHDDVDSVNDLDKSLQVAGYLPKE